MPRVSDDYYDKKRKEIIDAAYRVCIRKPITSVVMKDVIAETGFSHGVVYKYYKDLDDILCDLVSSINSENKLDEQLKSIFEYSDSKKWQEVIRDVCHMMAEHLQSSDMDILKISLYCDMLAMSDPERVSRIAERIGEDNQSPLLDVVEYMYQYMLNTIQDNSLKPIKNVDEIIEFMIATYHGIQTGYVLSAGYDADQLKGKYNPVKMFSCLAEAIISMMGGKE